MSESYSVTAFLKAHVGDYTKGMDDAIKKAGAFVDSQGKLRDSTGKFMSAADKAKHGLQDFGKGANQATDNTNRMRLSVGKLIAAAGGLVVLKKGFDMVTSSIDGAISRYDTLNNFPKVLEQIGFSAGDSEKSIKKLSEGIDGLPTALDEVAKTTQRMAVLTNDLDKATETTLALNNAFMASGSNSADASRGLDQYVQMLSKGEVDLQSWRTLQETMGVALNDTAKAFGFAGASAQNDLYDALKEGDITFDQFNSKIIELDGGVNGFAERARTASGGIATSWQNIKTAVVKGVTDMIGSIDKVLGGTGSIESAMNNMKTGVQKAFSYISGAIPEVVNKIKEVKKAIEPWIPTLVTVAAVAGSVLLGFYTYGKTVAIIGTVTKVVKILKSSMFGLNAVMAANPIGLIVAAIAGLVAMFIYLWNTNEGFKQFFINAWNTIKETAISVWESIKTIVMPIIQEIVSFVMSIWSTLVAFWNEHGQMILQAAQNVWSVVWNVIQTYATYIWSIIESVMNVIWDIMQAIWPAIQGIIKTTWNTIKGVIQGAIDVITGIIQFFSALFTGNWSALWDAVKKILSGALTIIKSVISGAFNLIKGIISTVFNAIKSIVSSVWNGIKDTISKVVNGIKDTVSNIFNSFKGIVSDAFSNVKNAVSDGINKALDIVNNIKDKFKEAGKNIIMSIVKGIKGQVDKVKDAISNVTQKIRDFLPFSPAKEGALRDIMKIQIGESIAKSIERSKGTVANAIGYKDGTTKEKAKKVGKLLRLFPKREVIAI